MDTTINEQEFRKLRARYNFENKYGIEGYQKLLDLAEQHALTDAMGAEFNLTGARISQILEVVLGMPYSLWLAKQGVRRKRVPGSHEL